MTKTSGTMPVSRRTVLGTAIAAGAAAATGGPLAALASPRRLTFSALGQALVKEDIRLDPYSDYALLVARLRRSDVVFTNLEVAINGPGAGPPTRDNEFFHETGPEVLDVLKDFNVNLLATGNNHSFDLNTGGILSTLDAVKRKGFVHAGTGRTIDEATQPAFLKVGTHTVALVAMAAGKIRQGGAATPTRPGVNEIRRHPDGTFFAEDEERTLAAVRKAAASADLVVTYHHNHYWEEPNFWDTPAWLRSWAKRCVEAGAGLHVGHGPPILHGIEFHRGRPILYGLGSFIFHSRTRIGHYRPEVWDSLIADMVFEEGRLASLSLTPVALNERGISEERHLETRGRPSLARGDRAARILDWVAKASAPMGTRITVDGGVGLVHLPAA